MDDPKTPKTPDDPKTQALPPGSYVNFLRIAHGPSEIYLAFGQSAPGQTPAAHLVSSLVTTPVHAKAMLRALATTVERYEKQFGEIPVAEPQPGAAGTAEERPADAGPAKRAPRGARRAR